MSALEIPDSDFLDPGQIPTLDMAAADGPLQPGTRLGGFLVLHALGSGGMGVVYAAQQERPRRTVAIKVLRRGFRHPEILRRFEHEAEMLGRLQHPGIAQVYDYGEPDTPYPPFLVLELVDGSSLAGCWPAGRWIRPASWMWSRRPPPAWMPRTGQAWCTVTSSRRTCWPAAAAW